MANQAPDGVILERQNSPLDLEVKSSIAPSLSKMFGIEAIGSAVLSAGLTNNSEIQDRIQDLREKLEKANPFTFSNGNQAAQLNQAGLIAAGAGIGGIATAYDRKEITRREEEDRRESVNAASRAIAAQESARRIAEAIAEFNKNLDNTLGDMANGNITADQAAQRAADDLKTQLETAKTNEEKLAIIEQAKDSVATHEHSTPELVSSFDQKTAAIKEQFGLNTKAVVGFGNENTINQVGTISSILAARISANTPNNSEGSSELSPSQFLTDLKQNNANFINNQTAMLDNLSAQIDVLQQDIVHTRSALRSEAGSELYDTIEADYESQLNEINELREELSLQRGILEQQIEVNTLTENYIEDKILPRLESGEAVDRAFIVSAIVESPPELEEATRRLNEMTGNEGGSDLISHFKSMAENPNIDPAQREEIVTLLNDIQVAQQKLNDANTLVESANDVIASENAMDPDMIGAGRSNMGNSFGLSALASGEDKMRYALDERQAAQEEFNALTGMDSSEKNPAVAQETIINDSPAPEPTEGFITGVQPVDAVFFAMNEDGIIDKADAERVLRETYGFSQDQIDEILPEIKAELDDEGYIITGMDDVEPVLVSGLIVNGRIVEPAPANSPQPPQNQPEPDHIRLAQQQYRHDQQQQPQAFTM